MNSFKTFAKFLVAFIFTATVTTFSAPPDSIENQIRDLDSILREIETHYGMLEFKEKMFGVTVSNLKEKYIRLIKEAKTIEEDRGLVKAEPRSILSREQFEQLMISLAADFHDGHFNILRYTSSSAWTVGLHGAEIDGEFVVTGFDEDLFIKNAARYEPKVGDRIISINGEAVAKIAERIEPSMSLATHRSRMNYAYRFMLRRANTWLPSVKSGDEVNIRFQRKNPKFKEVPEKKEGEAVEEVSATAAKEPRFLEFDALYHWTDLKDYQFAKSIFPFREALPKTQKYIYGVGGLKTYFSEGVKALSETVSVVQYDALFNAEIAKAKAEKSLVKDKPKTDEKKTNPDSVDFVSKEETDSLAKLEATSTIPAYIIRAEGKNIGVIRIPNYSMYIKEVRWLGTMIERLEKLTDVLVIDQLNNGGGYVWTGAQIARLFADKNEFRSMTMNSRLTKTLLSVLEAAAKGQENLPPAPTDEIFPGRAEEEEKNKDADLVPDANFAQIFLDHKQLEEWKARYEAGYTDTGWLPYFGVQNKFLEGSFGRIAGREGKVYTKPVLVLNNCMSASCGDFFPSIMQVNNRALILGETSMGLGAPLYRAQTTMPGSELFMRGAMGDALKPDNLPIENIGALPDLPFTISTADLADSFKNYTQAVIKVAKQLADGKTSDEVKAAYAKDMEKALPASAGFKEVKTIADVLKAKLALNETSSSDAIKAYEEFFSQLTAEKASKLKDNEWRSVPLSLPQSLLVRDMILMSLRAPDEVIDRLMQMRGLERFQSADDLALIDYLLRKLPSILKSRRNVCYDAMKALPEYRP